MLIHALLLHLPQKFINPWSIPGSGISDLCNLYTSVFKTSLLFHFLSTLICTFLGFSRMNIQGVKIDLTPWFYQRSYSTRRIFDFTTQVFKNKFSLSFPTFTSIINHLHSIPLFIFASPHSISLFWVILNLFISVAFIRSKKLKFKQR